MQVEIFKPATSKANNSETYIVGLGFRGISQPILESLLSHVGASTFDDKAMLPREALPASFVASVISAGRFFASRTKDFLEDAYVKRIAPPLLQQVLSCHCVASSVCRIRPCSVFDVCRIRPCSVFDVSPRPTAYWPHTMCSWGRSFQRHRLCSRRFPRHSGVCLLVCRVRAWCIMSAAVSVASDGMP